MNTKAKDKLIVALDIDTPTQAMDLFEALRDVVGMFKIGSQLFTAAGRGRH
jgi:orotidine-5'-phosphate decarboxylase